MAFDVRRLERTEGALLRRLRIEALRDSPAQFGETLADALSRTGEEWLRLAASTHVAEVAEVDGTLVGMVFAFADKSAAAIGVSAGCGSRLGLGAPAPGLRSWGRACLGQGYRRSDACGSGWPQRRPPSDSIAEHTSFRQADGMRFRTMIPASSSRWSSSWTGRRATQARRLAIDSTGRA